MAFVDSRGLIGRPSLRRALAGMSNDQLEQFGAFTSDIDPRRFSSLYKQRAQEFLDQEREMAQMNSQAVLAERNAQRADARRRQQFGRSPNEILGLSDDENDGSGVRRSLRRSVYGY